MLSLNYFYYLNLKEKLEGKLKLYIEMNWVVIMDNNAFNTSSYHFLLSFFSVPEVISLPITGGNLKYLEWLKESTRDWLSSL